MLCDALQPVEAATVAGFYYKSAFGTPWFPFATTDLRSILYTGNYWRSGLLCRNVIRAATALVKAKKRVTLVTSNYETFLEQEFETQAKLLEAYPDQLEALPAFEIDVLGEYQQLLEYGSLKNGLVTLTYLHGRIPSNGEAEGRVGLTEQDYFDLREGVLSALSEVLGDGSPLLIVGSSLTDPPLLAALQASRPEQWSSIESDRFALTPIPSYSFDELEHAHVNVLMSQLRNRMEVFGVSLLFPDFYYQVPQFLEELVTSLKESASPIGYAERPGIRYGRRLTDWWQAWVQTHTKSEDVEAAYDILVGALREIRRFLAPPRQGIKNSATELLKIEVWVRWEPSETTRELGLWSVSTGVRRDFDSIHRPDLDSGSDYEAVQAFSMGAPRLRHLTEPPNRRNSESPWHTFLSVPVSFDDELGSVPVGVVCLVGSRGDGNSRIELQDAAKMQQLVDELREYGRQLLAVTSPAVAHQASEESIT